MESKDYTISVGGCDDSTVFTISLTPEESNGVQKVIDLCNKTSTSICEPRMNIKEGIISKDDFVWDDK